MCIVATQQHGTDRQRGGIQHGGHGEGHQTHTQGPEWSLTPLTWPIQHHSSQSTKYYHITKSFCKQNYISCTLFTSDMHHAPCNTCAQATLNVPFLKTLEIEMNTLSLVQIFHFLIDFPFIPSLKPGIMLELLLFITTQPLLKLHF